VLKVALIAPKNLLDYTRLGEMHFIVPRNANKRFFRYETMYKMLDNGTYELGEPMNIEDLIDLALSMRVDEIVLPDVMRNRKMTSALTMHAVRSIKPKGMRFAAVPQGGSLHDFVECYRDFAKIPEIDVLCFPIWLEKIYHARPHVIWYIHRKGYWTEEKEHHLIGLDRISELFCYPKGAIRSVDTSLPFSVAFQQSTLSDLGEYTGPRVNLDNAIIHPEYVRYNIRVLLEAASYV